MKKVRVEGEFVEFAGNWWQVLGETSNHYTLASPTQEYSVPKSQIDGDD